MKGQKGLSLIELMIAILISSLLLLGVLQIFSNTSASDRTNTAVARVQESGRIAIEIIGVDARRAGYQGCTSASNVLTIDSLTFPEAALDASDRSLTFRYATPVDTGTPFGINKTCSNAALYLNDVTYSNCPRNGTLRICKKVNGGAADPILDNAVITEVFFGIPSGSDMTWKESADISATELEKARSLRLSLTITDAREEISQDFSGTYELRNRF